MPAKGRSAAYIKGKIKKLLGEGKKQDRAVAIALDMARRKKK